MSLTEQEAADLRDIAMRVRSRHCEEGGDVGAHTVALAVAKLLDENERLKAELGIAEDLVAAGITKRDKLRAELRKLRAELAAANAHLANALNIPMPAPNSQDWEKVGASWELPSQAVVSEAVAHAVTVGTKARPIKESIAELKRITTIANARIAVLEASKAYRTLFGDDIRNTSGSVLALLTAVDALNAVESTADGPEQTDGAAVMPS